MKKVLIMVAISLLTISCSKDTPDYVSRTLFIYMSANNSLSPWANQNIDLIKRVAENSGLNGGRVIVLWRRKPTSADTDLVEIKLNNKGRATEVILKTYGGNGNASDAQVLRASINDMMLFAPAQSYGLIMWSHALGWIPAQEEKKKGRSFGEDAGRRMNITDMSDAIDDGIFDFIIFDCCLMGNIETLYQIRNKASFVVASPAEIIEDGMPYNKIIPRLFKSTSYDLRGVCNDYFNEGSSHRVISLYDMSKIEGVATAFRTIVSQEGENKIANTGTSGVQCLFDFIAQDKGIYDYWAYDMEAIANAMTSNTTALKSAISSFVLLHKYTPTGFVDVSNSCGVGMSAPLTRYDQTAISWNPFYKTLDWYTNTYK